MWCSSESRASASESVRALDRLDKLDRAERWHSTIGEWWRNPANCAEIGVLDPLTGAMACGILIFASARGSTMQSHHSDFLARTLRDKWVLRVTPV